MIVAARPDPLRVPVVAANGRLDNRIISMSRLRHKGFEYAGGWTAERIASSHPCG
jgi:hypothetical protein